MATNGNPSLNKVSDLVSVLNGISNFVDDLMLKKSL